MLCQNTCDVPFGITAMVRRSLRVLPPEQAAVNSTSANAARPRIERVVFIIEFTS